jgi:hypothetical protein
MLDFQRDVLPVLRKTYDLMDEHRTDMLDGDELAPLLGPDRTKIDLYNLFRRLHEAEYVKVRFAGGMNIAFVSPTEKGLQTTRGWPMPGQSHIEALLGLLDERIESPDTPEDERNGLRRLRDAAGTVSQSVLSSVLSAWLAHVTKLSGSQ